MPLKIDIELEGLSALRRLLEPPENLYAKPWEEGMDKLASMGGLAAQRSAPLATGKLQGSIRTRVQKKPFPTWIAIRVGARARKTRYPYPRLLAFSQKHGHKDWLLKAVQPVWRGAEDVLRKAGDIIARRWAR